MKILGKVKIGRANYILISEFISKDNETLYVGTFEKNGIWCHKIIGKRENGEWYLRS